MTAQAISLGKFHIFLNVRSQNQIMIVMATQVDMVDDDWDDMNEGEENEEIVPQVSYQTLHMLRCYQCLK